MREALNGCTQSRCGARSADGAYGRTRLTRNHGLSAAWGGAGLRLRRSATETPRRRAAALIASKHRACGPILPCAARGGWHPRQPSARTAATASGSVISAPWPPMTAQDNRGCFPYFFKYAVFGWRLAGEKAGGAEGIRTLTSAVRRQRRRGFAGVVKVSQSAGAGSRDGHRRRHK